MEKMRISTKVTFIILVFLGIRFVFADEWIKIHSKFEPSLEVNGYGPTSFIDRNEGWFTSENSETNSRTIWKTSDGGLLWILNRLFNGQIGLIKFFNYQNGFVLSITRDSHNYLIETAYLLKTADGGETWQKTVFEDLPDEAYHLIFINTLKGFAFASSAIYYTENSGVTWLRSKTDFPTGFYIEKLFFIDQNTGWAIGTNSDYTDTGILLNTSDSGKSWQIQQKWIPTMKGLYFIDSTFGALVGHTVKLSGDILITHDGGKNWLDNEINGPTLVDVEFIDKFRGWAVGYYGYIWKTEDGGDSWQIDSSGTEEHLLEINFVENGSVGYITGRNNTLLRYDNDVNSLKYEDEINNVNDSNISVGPNYPNPFNSFTTINISLPEISKVSLKVYDITGHLVSEIINSTLPTGKHEVNFDGSKLASGLYIYKLTANSLISKKSYSHAKRMLLIK